MFADVLAQNPFVIRENNEYGYMNYDGKKVINCIFKEAEDFDSLGHARVRLNDKYGILKPDNTWFLKPEYDFIGKYNYGYAYVYLSEKNHFYIDVLGKRQKNKEKIDSFIRAKIEKLNQEERRPKSNNRENLVFQKFENYQIRQFGFYKYDSPNDTIFISDKNSELLESEQQGEFLYIKHKKLLSDKIIHEIRYKKAHFIFSDNENIGYTLDGNQVMKRYVFSKVTNIYKINIGKDQQINVSSFDIPSDHAFDKIEKEKNTNTFIIYTDKRCYLTDSTLNCLHKGFDLTKIEESYGGNRWACDERGDCGVIDANFKWIITHIYHYYYPIGKLRFIMLNPDKDLLLDVEKGDFLFSSILNNTKIFYFEQNNETIHTFYFEMNGSRALIDENGKFIIPFGYDSIDIDSPYQSSNIIQAKKGDYYYFFDVQGNLLIKSKSKFHLTLLNKKDRYIEFTDQYHIFENPKTHKFGVSSENFKEIIPAKYKEIQIISNAKYTKQLFEAFFRNPKDSNKLYFHIFDVNGKKLTKKPLLAENYQQLELYPEKEINVLINIPQVEGGPRKVTLIKPDGTKIKKVNEAYSTIFSSDGKAKLFTTYDLDSVYFIHSDGRVLHTQAMKKVYDADTTLNITYMASPPYFSRRKTPMIDSISGLILIENKEKIFVKKGISLHVTTDIDTIGRYWQQLGLAVYLSNNTSDSIELGMQDGNLSGLRTEASDSNQVWRPIEHLEGSGCGNSYYNYTMKAYTSEQFVVSKYHGPFKTKLRLRFNNTISNEYDGEINYAQFYRKIVNYDDEMMLPKYFLQN